MDLANPFDGMTDDDVLARARKALIRASEMTPGSIERTIQWAVFDSAMMELDRRAVRYVLMKLGRGCEREN